MKLPSLSFFRRLIFGIVPISGVFVLGGCGDQPGAGTSSGKPVVVASVAPVAGIVKRIAGDRLEVQTLAGANDDPHGFSPTPKQLVSLGDAAGFFVVGMPFEGGLVEKLKSGTKGLRIVNVTEGIDHLEMDEHHHHHDHDHDHDHEAHPEPDEEAHDHGEMNDPHVWLSPSLLKNQAIAIEHALYEIDPDGHELFHQNLDALLAELDALDAELTEALAPMKGQSFYVYHGAFAYFAQAYGLEQEAIEISGRSPEPKRIFELIEKAKEEEVRLILVQPQFDSTSARSIAESINGTVVPVNPMEEDVIANLRLLAREVAASRGK